MFERSSRPEINPGLPGLMPPGVSVRAPVNTRPGDHCDQARVNQGHADINPIQYGGWKI